MLANERNDSGSFASHVNGEDPAEIAGEPRLGNLIGTAFDVGNGETKRHWQESAVLPWSHLQTDGHHGWYLYRQSLTSPG